MGKLYTEDSIESLSPLEFTRLRPGVYCGDTTYSTQLLVEIVSNAVDEFRLGHGNKIDVAIKGDMVRVRDYGQGFIPNSFREDGKTILEAAFSVLNTSGKYREDGTYEGTSLGSFGIGSKITTYLSHWLCVITYRDGSGEQVDFKEGVFASRAQMKQSVMPSGTIVEWQPSEEFFTHTEVEIEKIRSLFNTIACLCPGLTIELDYNGKKENYYSERGLDDLADKAIADSEILRSRCKINMAEGKNKMDFILTYTNGYGMTIVPYVNTGLTEKGPHITQIKTLITREFNKFFREKKWLKDKSDNLTGDDIQEGMYIVFNITAPNVSYDAQVKSTITKIDMTPFTSALATEIQYWLSANEKEVKKIADKAISAKKAREAARKAREAVRGKADKKSKLLNLPTKLVDSWSKKRENCELLIAEGDSAANGLIGARDGEFQAVFPIRGKILNIYKASGEKVLANAEVINIIKAIGLDFDAKTQTLNYDLSKLRYGKIILAADADADGQAIRNLLLTYFWSICPELLLNGHIYVAIPPLFRITTKKNQYIYLKDAEALAEYNKTHAGEKYVVNRNKGLGEQDPSELEECLLNPATRNVQQIIVEDPDMAEEMFEIFMGKNVTPRKEFMLAHSEEANV